MVALDLAEAGALAEAVAPLGEGLALAAVVTAVAVALRGAGDVEAYQEPFQAPLV